MSFASQYRFTMTIGGHSVRSDSSFDVINPATEALIAKAPDCSSAQLDEAVAAARRAFPAWRQTPYIERQNLVAAIGDVFMKHQTELSQLLTAEQGKPLEDAGWEIMGAAFGCKAFSSLTLPETVNEDTSEQYSVTRHVPLGVIGAIAPWNFPIGLAMLKVPPALLAGNTVILKPSPFTPLTTLRIGELLRDVLPVGVLNVVSGGDALGPMITSHVGIDKISFTGSTQTGRKVMMSAAATLKRVTLELGGNDPAIVLPDVDVRKTAEQIFWAAFRNSGQICVAAKRIYIHKDIYEPLSRAIADYAKAVKLGDGVHQGVQLGPVQNKLQYDRVRSLIEDGMSKGYKLLAGGEIPSGRGFFIPVTIFDNPPEDSRIVKEEQFGPVLPLLKVDNIDEAIVRANDSEYGLAASVWSANDEAALKVAEQLNVGTVWINQTLYLPPLAPFSGHKQSGIGVENGLDGLLEYTLPKTTTLKRRH